MIVEPYRHTGDDHNNSRSSPRTHQCRYSLQCDDVVGRMNTGDAAARLNDGTRNKVDNIPPQRR